MTTFFYFIILRVGGGGGGVSHHYFILQRGDGVRTVFLRKPLYQFNIAGHQMVFRWRADDGLTPNAAADSFEISRGRDQYS